MNDLERWQSANEEYLFAALTWLRLRLERLAGPAAPAPVIATAESLPPAQPPPTQPASKWSFLGRAAGAAPSSAAPRAALALPPAPAGVTDEEIARAAEAMAAAEAADPPPALVLVGRRLGLSKLEREVLLLCAAMELDTRIAGLCAAAQGDPGPPWPTFALALALFDDPAWEVLSPERPLRFWRLLEINQPGAQSLTASALRADERIVSYLKGLDYLDDRLTPLLVPFGMGAEEDLPPSQRAAVEAAVAHLARGSRSPSLPVVQLLGPDAPSKQLVARHAAAALGLHLYRLPAGMLPVQPAEVETLARLWQRESLLLPVALYAEGAEAEGPAAPGQASALARFLARARGVSFLETSEAWRNLGPDAVAVEVAKPAPAEQQEAWAAALGEAAGDSPARLAGQFSLGLAALRRIVGEALAEDAGDGPTLHDRLWKACRLHTRPRLEALAVRLEPKAAWDDLVLPEADKGLLRQIADQVAQRGLVYDEWGFRRRMNRGLGINALFAGDSGTGKTMAAEVIANDLRLDLYRIDLSAVVSKYIGETEKNLRSLFDAAEGGGAILFFDEADALFGKRSEVRDSHDRYANIEINYLLQRMESYAGLAILATNRKGDLDSAFLRRLRFIVNFPFPAQAERRTIWEKVFPAEAPVGALDIERLARLNLTGGNIHNIALNAAFRAARSGGVVTMPLVLEAARAELRKLDRPINEADFRWAEPAPAEVVA